MAADALLDIPEEEPDPLLLVGDPVDEEDEGEPPIEYDDEDKNIAFILQETKEGEKEARKIVDKVIRDFDAAWEGSEEFRDRTARNWRLFMGELPPKAAEFAGTANVHVPMAIENITRVYLRAYGELFGDFKKPFAAVPTRNDPIAIAEAEIATKHTNWQLRTQIPDFRRQTHRIVLGFFMIGDIPVHSYRDEVLNINRHEVLTPDQFVIPYVYTTTMPDYSDCPFRVRILEYYDHDIEKMRGKWAGIDELLEKHKPGWDDEPEQPLGESVSEVQGIRKPDAEDIGAPYKCLWYEGWMTLPNQTEERFCCAIVERHSRTLLKLYIHEYDDWQDADRYKRDEADMATYRQQYDAYSGDMKQRETAAEQAVQAHAQGLIGDQMLQDGLDYAAQSAPPPPVAPAWATDPHDPETKPRPIKKKPVHLFTHMVCIEPFVGNLGIGYGQIQSDLNTAANILVCQTIDQATFGNLPVNLVDESLEFKDDAVLKPGKFIKVSPGASGSVADSLHQIQLGQANPQLMELTQMLWGWAQSSMQSPNVLSGESGKSGETRGGLLARIEQATKQLSVITAQIAEGMSHIYKHNSFLNYLYMDDMEIVHVTTDVTEVPEELHVSREIYAPGYDWEPTSDLRFSAEEQKVMEADQAFQLVSNPVAMQVHQNPLLVKAALRKMLVVRGWNDLVKIFDQPPPPPPPPPQGAPGAQPGGPPEQPPQGPQGAPLG